MADDLAEADGEEVEHAGTLRIEFLGNVLPHWRYSLVEGDRDRIQDLVARAHAAIGLLPVGDPQLRRNQNRVDRDAAREGVTIEWVGVETPDPDRSSRPHPPA